MTQNTEQQKQATEFMVTLSGTQLLQALDFIAPDRATDPSQLEGSVRIAKGDGHQGYGYYCWGEDYPEEGSFLLTDDPPVTEPTPFAQGDAPTVDRNSIIEECALAPSNLAALADGLESIKGNENAARAAAVLRQLSDAKWDQRAEDSAIVGRMSRMLAEISALVSPDVPLENHYFADLVERVRVAVAPPAAQGEALAAPLNNSKILDLAISSGMTADDGVYRGNAAAVLRFAGALRRVAMELDTRGFTALEVLRVIRMSMGWQSLSDECRKLVDAALKENGNG
ncbi:hypothetical protein NUK34_07920 [Kerstersia gyiorum]|uniref:hypothetical protein n=1 Tax=Kerstersia gyiorum TaxID=206506 RepID=UPI00214FCB82|nr:hypothetical protein [Kerstersia gyiorum]MCR4158777.1 hypothetical protein [Kerstersia gyiorum]